MSVASPIRVVHVEHIGHGMLSVIETTWNGELASLYKMLRCDLVTVVHATLQSENANGTPISIYADDEFWLRNNEDKPYPAMFVDGQIIVGPALVVGLPDDQGRDTACPVSGQTIGALFDVGMARNPLEDGGAMIAVITGKAP